MFGGSAWTWDEQTEQYYMHSFLPEQPDLNWRNPDVVEAMHNALRFWLNRGVDGFRVDAILCLIKHESFQDNPPVEPGSYWEAWGHLLEPRYTVNQPEMFEHVRLMRRVFDEFNERVHIGETATVDVAGLIPYYGQPLDGYDIPFNFKLLHADWHAPTVRSIIEDYYDILPEGGWPNFVFGNHDIHRFATRYGYENHRSVAMLLLTLWGIPTLYYGDELGMEDVFIPVEQRIDPWGINMPDSDFGRDPERTPMQWDSSSNAGLYHRRAVAAPGRRLRKAQRGQPTGRWAIDPQLLQNFAPPAPPPLGTAQWFVHIRRWSGRRPAGLPARSQRPAPAGLPQFWSQRAHHRPESFGQQR